MNENWVNLSNAVVLQAARDYREARGKLKKNPRDKEAKLMIADCEEFFRSGWFMAFTDLDGKALLRQLKEEEA